MAYSKTSISLPGDVMLWTRAYAKARGVEVSRLLAELLVEKRAELKVESRERAPIRKILRRIPK